MKHLLLCTVLLLVVQFLCFASSANPIWKVNAGSEHQTIHGFGVSSAWMGSAPLSTTLADLLWNIYTGAGLSLLRTRLAPDGTTEVGAAQQAQASGVTVWTTPWTPPAYMKTNNNIVGGKLLPSQYANYSNYLINYVHYTISNGIKLYALSLQNEPSMNVSYECCVWDAQDFYNFLQVFQPIWKASGLSTYVMFPEDYDWTTQLGNTAMADSTLASVIDIISAHDYYEPNGLVQLNSWGKPMWYTEWFATCPTTPDYGIDCGLILAQKIHNALTIANVNTYHYWWITSSADGGLTINDQPTARLWVMGNWARWVRPGWVRVDLPLASGSDSNLYASAFKDPSNGHFALVVVNTNPWAVWITFQFSGVSSPCVIPWFTDATHSLAILPKVDSSGAGFGAWSNASSVITFTSFDWLNGDCTL